MQKKKRYHISNSQKTPTFMGVDFTNFGEHIQYRYWTVLYLYLNIQYGRLCHMIRGHYIPTFRRLWWSVWLYFHAYSLLYVTVIANRVMLLICWHQNAITSRAKLLYRVSGDGSRNCIHPVTYHFSNIVMFVGCKYFEAYQILLRRT